MRDWLVAADDRTGAFEVAALLAASVGPVTVAVGSPVSGACVVDLGSRALSAVDAAARAAAIEAEPSRWTAHKMDSTLRGHWAAEVTARQAVSGRRAIVLPGWPALGRTCVAGVVHVHGAAVGRVQDHLPSATPVGDADGLRAWLAGDGMIAICDIVDDDSMHAVAAVAAGADALLVGPAGPLGAAFAASHDGRAPLVATVLDGPVLVVCGSANPVSREQIARLASLHPSVTIIAAPDAEGPLDAEVAQHLAAVARDAATRLMPATIVILGGDTAAAYLGDAPRLIGGSVAAGMPWSRDADGGGALVVTKAGGFGGPDALVALLGRSGRA